MTDEKTPPPGSYNWLLGEQLTHTVEVPVPGSNATLRVEIMARARIYPSRGWALVIIVWGLLVLLLLANHARAATWEDQNAQRRTPPWPTWESQRSAPGWNPVDTSRSYTVGPNTYTDIQRRDGSKERCRSWQTGPNVYTKCE